MRDIGESAIVRGNSCIAAGALTVFAMALLAGCSGEKAAVGGSAAVTHDSSGVMIAEYGADAWQAAPTWALSAKPLALITGGTGGSINPGSAMAGAMLSDGRVALALNEPVALVMFNAVGDLLGQMGGAGQGPGEYQRLAQVLRLGGDTVFAFDVATLKGLRYSADGAALSERDFSRPDGLPPILRGRLDDGSFVFSVEAFPTPPANGPSVFRNRLAVLAFRDRAWDTVVVTDGATMAGTNSGGAHGEGSARSVIYGPSTQVAVSGDRVFVATAEQFALSGYDGTGALKEVIRVALPDRPVGALDRDKYKATVMASLTQGNAGVSPDALQRQLAALDSVPFADKLPAVGQLLTDGAGRIWANAGFSLADSTRSWGVFDRQGHLLGRVTTPLGSVMAIGNDRLLLRRVDDKSGQVKLEVWGVTEGQ
jgi:hypothetical protein